MSECDSKRIDRINEQDKLDSNTKEMCLTVNKRTLAWFWSFFISSCRLSLKLFSLKALVTKHFKKNKTKATGFLAVISQMAVSCLRRQGTYDFQAGDVAWDCTWRQDYYKGIKMAQENICQSTVKWGLEENERRMQAGGMCLRNFLSWELWASIS